MVNEEISWLIFIRAGSRRFPNKCYEPIGRYENILEMMVINASKASIQTSDIFLCTSSNLENKRLIDQAERLGIRTCIGPEAYPIQRITGNEDLLCRYKYVVRICGDSPMYPFRAVKRIVSAYDKDDTFAITNTRLRNFPAGYSIEAYRSTRLFEYLQAAAHLTRLEHMCDILKEPEELMQGRIVDILGNQELDFFRAKRYTVDNPEDIDHIDSCIERDEPEYYNNCLDMVRWGDGGNC